MRNPCTPDIGADEVTPYSGPSLAKVSISKTADAPFAASGSQIGFTVRLTNNSSFTATGVTFTDNLPAAPGVNWSIDAANTDTGWSVSGSPPNQSLVYSPTTLTGGTTTRAHVISATTMDTCGSTLNNMAAYTVSNACPGAGSGSASASVSVVGAYVPVFSENFDGVTPPALPPGWVATNAVDPDMIFWQSSNSGVPTPVADSIPNAAWVNDPALVSDKRLDSPSIAITSNIAQLTFRQNYAFEGTTTFFDGGVLEISIGGGAFQDIVAAGGSFVTGGYTGTISSSFSIRSAAVRRGVPPPRLYHDDGEPAACRGRAECRAALAHGQRHQRHEFGLEDRQHRPLPARGLSSCLTNSHFYGYSYSTATSTATATATATATVPPTPTAQLR